MVASQLFKLNFQLESFSFFQEMLLTADSSIINAKDPNGMTCVHLAGISALGVT
jgi:hypothetical protein